MDIITMIRRGGLEARLEMDAKNQYMARVYQKDKQLKEAGPYYDQDEAEVELGALLDVVWREMSSTKEKLVRRL